MTLSEANVHYFVVIKHQNVGNFWNYIFFISSHYYLSHVGVLIFCDYDGYIVSIAIILQGLKEFFMHGNLTLTEVLPMLPVFWALQWLEIKTKRCALFLST